MKTKVVFSALLASVLIEGAALADDVGLVLGRVRKVAIPVAVDDEADKPAPPPPPFERARAPEMNLSLGVRGTLVRDAGFDPYAQKDMLAQIAIAAGPTFARSGDVSFAALVEWSWGTAKATARGDDTSLGMHRIGLSLMAFYHPVKRLGLYAKLSPGAVHLRGEIADSGIERPLVARTWAFSMDAAGGLALMIANAGRARFWLTTEFGYSFATSADMVFSPLEDETDPRTYGSVTLPALRLAGPFGKFAFATTF